MTKPLVFMMGRSPTFLPTDRKYARNHMWACAAGAGYRVGLSAYAVKLLGDVHHLEWSAEPQSRITSGQEIGFIEGSKATSDLYAPMAGKVVEINHAVLADPTLVNSNLYDAGWLLAIALPSAGHLQCPAEWAGEHLLSPEEYLALLEASWPLAQRLLKGQVGANHG